MMSAVGRGVLLLVLAAPAPAAAYVRTTNASGMPLAWGKSDLVLLQMQPGPPDLSGLDARTAIQAAVAAWSYPIVSCTTLELKLVTDTAGMAPQVANDMRPQLIFRTDRWCDGMNCHNPESLAITTVFARASDGTILDADIELNAVNHRWTMIPAGGVNPLPGARDLSNVLAHELGHFLGLSEVCAGPGTPASARDHLGNPVPQCANAPAELREATMFHDLPPDDTSKRTLAADDILGVCALFPRYPAQDAGADGSADGQGGPDTAPGMVPPPDAGGPVMPGAGEGCDCRIGSGGAPTPGWLVVALLAILAQRRRVRRRCG